MRTSRKIKTAAKLVAIVMGFAATAEAKEIFMSEVVDNWDNPAAWTDGVVPGASDWAVVEGSGYRRIYITNGVDAVAERFTIARSSGVKRTGYCEMSGGNLTLSGHLLMASGSSINRAYFTLSDGTANIANGRIGQYGCAVFTQTGGTLISPYWIIGQYANCFGTNLHSAGKATLSTYNALSLGHEKNATGVYRLSGSGLLELSGTAQIGSSGIGVFEQSGGTVTGNAEFRIGNSSNATGRCVLNDGEFAVALMYAGMSGRGHLEQSGGTATIGGSISLGNDATAVGTALFNGGSFIATNNLYVGRNGYGCVTQYAGSVTINALIMADETGSGAYALFGGTLSSRTQNIGYNGSGVFEQYGGTNINNGWCNIGYFKDIPGTYTMHDGYMQATNLLIAGGASGTGGAIGTFNLNGGLVAAIAEVRVGSYGIGSLTQTGGELICTNNVEVGMRAGAIGVYTQSGGVLRANNVIVCRDAGSLGRYVIAGGMASITNLTVGNGTNRDGTLAVVGTNAEVTVSGQLIIGVSGTYEVTLTPDGFTAPSCATLSLSSLASLKVNASELLPHAMDNTEITILTFGTAAIPDKTFGTVTVDAGTEYGELRSATVNYYPDRITLKVRVLRPPYATVISIL